MGKENTRAHLKMHFALKYYEIMQILSFKTNLKTFNSFCHSKTRKYKQPLWRQTFY
jgi:hypothetical protein